jgi:hypothetical protein
MITIPPKSPRSLSAIWFAFVAYVVVLVIFRNAPASYSSDFFIWQIVPIIVGGLVGFTFGHQVLEPEKVRKPIEAIAVGIKVSVITYVAYLLIAYVLIIIYGIIGWRQLRISWQVYTFFYVTFYYGWLIIVAGAAAGWLLYHLFRQKTVGE